MPTRVNRSPDFYDGEVLKCAELDGLALGEIQYASGYERPPHTHERACFHFLFQGGYVEYQEKRSRECKTFTLSFQPKGHEHSYRSSPVVSRAFTIELEDAWLAQLSDHSVILDKPTYSRGGLESWLITRMYNEFCAMQTASSLVIEALAVEVAVEVSRTTKRVSDAIPPPWLKQVKDILHDRFNEQLSLRRIAVSVGVHPVHLARVFRRHHHCTVGEYIRRLRIEFAAHQLTHSNATLLEIALAAGFSDQSQFSHTFKRAMGLTPAGFRSEMRPR